MPTDGSQNKPVAAFLDLAVVLLEQLPGVQLWVFDAALFVAPPYNRGSQ